ncbi:TrmB family transcriptional regulator [Clostridium sp. JNZ X4-2]
MDRILELLKNFDLTDVEAKVYIELLKNGPSTGYEISKISAVPRSRVYNVLSKLVKNGFVVASKSKNPTYYNCISVDEFINNKKFEYNSLFSEMSSELKKVERSNNMDYIWYINGYNNIFNKCRNILKKSKKEVYVQLWMEDAPQIHAELKTLDNRDIPLLTVLYSSEHKYKLDLKLVYRHGFEDEKHAELGGRLISIVSDDKEVVFGRIFDNEESEVIWTENRSLVFLVKEYVKHDAYCLKLIDSVEKSNSNKLNQCISKI